MSGRNYSQLPNDLGDLETKERYIDSEQLCARRKAQAVPSAHSYLGLIEVPAFSYLEILFGIFYPSVSNMLTHQRHCFLEQISVAEQLLNTGNLL